MISRCKLETILTDTVPLLTYLGVGANVTIDVPHMGHMKLTYTSPSEIVTSIVGYEFSYLLSQSYNSFIEEVTTKLAYKTHSQLVFKNGHACLEKTFNIKNN